VNDASTDRTSEVIRRLRNKYFIILINHDKNLGYGAAQKSAFNQFLKLNLGCAVLLHADGQYPPEYLFDMIKPILRNQADVVGGSRLAYGRLIKQKMPVYKYLGNILSTKLLNLAYRSNLNSYHSGYKAYSRKALKIIDFKSLSDYFYFDTQMLLAALHNNLSIQELPIPTYYGDEVSYLDPIKYGFGIIKIILGGLRNAK
jgi:glycosyltransferase involved in cell wall biosynthesis